MSVDRIKEIHLQTSYPESISVQQALLAVWNETTQEYKQSIITLIDEMSDTSEMGVTGNTQYWIGYKTALTELKQKIEAL